MTKQALTAKEWRTLEQASKGGVVPGGTNSDPITMYALVDRGLLRAGQYGTVHYLTTEGLATLRAGV